MSFFGSPRAATAPAYTGLQLQTSTSILPVAILWGCAKAAANVVWYANFRSHNVSSGGKGGLFRQPSGQSYYTADLILALCEGAIDGVGEIWRDQSAYTLAELSLTLFDGATPQSVWGYLSSAYPSQALAYQGTAYVCAASYYLGASASIGNHNFEIIRNSAFLGVNGIDADPALVIEDFLTNPQYGAGFSADSINAATLLGSSGDASLQSYCKAAGIAFSPLLSNQEQASSILARWLQICNCAAVWSGASLKFIPYGDVAIAAGAHTSRAVQVAIPVPIKPASGSTPPPKIVVCPAAQFISDGGVSYAFSGASLTYIGAATPSAAGTYGISPAGTYLFAPGDEDKVVAIAYVASIPCGYAPDLTPVYALDDEDFVDEKNGNDPLTVSRVDPFTLPNIQRIECMSRNNQYAITPVEARDQSQIDAYGPRVGSSIQAHEICDDVTVGPIVAQAILQRQLYVRAHYAFKLSWEYCLLEPMDIVEISDSNLGLSALAVRVISVEEDENGLLAVTAEDLTVSISTPVLYPVASAAKNVPNQGVYAQPVNSDPLIWEAPAALTDGAMELWLGASGGVNGVADPNWGGAYVWMSLDGATYSQIATIAQPLRQGLATAALAAASGWDAVDTLSVGLGESGGVLSGATAAAAQAGGTLSLIDSELVAYESATLTGANAYDLNGLERGLYQTIGASHVRSAPFRRLDGAVVKYPMPTTWLGKTIYFKFQSFNIWGGGVQDISTCAAFSHTVAGLPLPSAISIASASLTQQGVSLTLVAAWSADPLAVGYVAEYSINGGASYTQVQCGAALSFSVPGLAATTVWLRVAGISANGYYGPWSTAVEVTSAAIDYGTVFQNSAYQQTIATIDSTLTAVESASQALAAVRVDAGATTAAATEDAGLIATFLSSAQAQAQAQAASTAAALASANIASVITGTFSSLTTISSLNSLSNLLIGEINSNYLAFNQFASMQVTTNSTVAGELSDLRSTVGSDYTTLSGSISDIETTLSSNLIGAAAAKTDAVSASDAAAADQQTINDFLTAFEAGQQTAAALSAANSALAATATTQWAYANASQAIASLASTTAAQLGANSASIVSEAQTRASADSSLSTQISNLTSTVGTNTTAISNEAQTRASADSSLSTQISNLTSTVGTNTTAISNEAQTRASADSSLSTQISNLTSTVGTNSSDISSLQSTQSGQAATLSSVQSTLTSQAGSISSLQSTQSTQASELSSLSGEVSTLQATAVGVSAGGTMEWVAQAAPSGALAAWKLVVTAAGQASSSATMLIAAMSDGSSLIYFDAGHFAIGNTTTNTVPFTMNSDGSLTLGGVTNISSIIQSVGKGANGQPYMTQNFGSSPSIVFDDGT